MKKVVSLNSVMQYLPLVIVFLCAFVFVDADTAQAASEFKEFEDVFQKVEKFITGPVGKVISIAGMACCGIVYIFARQDMSEGFKMLLQVLFGISFIAFASSIIGSIFNFGGAMI